MGRGRYRRYIRIHIHFSITRAIGDHRGDIRIHFSIPKMEGESRGAREEERGAGSSRRDSGISSRPSSLSPSNDRNADRSSRNINGGIRGSNPSPSSPNNENSRLRSTSSNTTQVVRESTETFNRIFLEIRNLGSDSPIENIRRARGDIQRGADRAAVEQLAHIIISEEYMNSNNNNSECSICQEPYGIGEEARAMECGHMHHQICLFQWLNNHRTCPLCRFEMPSANTLFG